MFPFGFAGRGLVSAAGGDTTAPALVSATIAADGLSIALLYDEPLDTGSVPAAGAYSLSGTDATVDSVGVSGSTVTLTLTAGTPVLSADTVTIDYTAGANPVQDTAGNNAANLSGQATVNNSTAIAPDQWGLTEYLIADSGITGSPVSEWQGQVAGWRWEQATGSNQPAYDATDVDWNDQPALAFDSTDHLQLSASDYSLTEQRVFIDGSTDWEINLTIRSDPTVGHFRVILGNADATDGFYLVQFTTGGERLYFAWRVGGSTVASVVTPAPVGVEYSVRIRLDAVADEVGMKLDDGPWLTASVPSYSSGDADGSLTLGTSPNGSSGWSGKVTFASFRIGSLPNEAQRTIEREWLQDKYGVTLP